MTENENVEAVGAEPVMPPKKIASRPGSMWATGKRTNVKGFPQPKGFARGASVKCVTKPVTSEKPVK